MTSAFAGKILDSYQYLFLVMYKDYTDFGRAFVKEFNTVYLERLAMDLKGRGTVIVPFKGNIEQTRQEVISVRLAIPRGLFSALDGEFPRSSACTAPVQDSRRPGQGPESLSCVIAAR